MDEGDCGGAACEPQPPPRPPTGPELTGLHVHWVGNESGRSGRAREAQERNGEIISERETPSVAVNEQDLMNSHERPTTERASERASRRWMSAGEMGIYTPDFQLQSPDNELHSRAFPFSSRCEQKVLIPTTMSCLVSSSLLTAPSFREQGRH